jgi:hypothetical protein
MNHSLTREAGEVVSYSGRIFLTQQEVKQLGKKRQLVAADEESEESSAEESSQNEE